MEEFTAAFYDTIDLEVANLIGSKYLLSQMVRLAYCLVLLRPLTGVTECTASCYCVHSLE